MGQKHRHTYEVYTQIIYKKKENIKKITCLISIGHKHNNTGMLKLIKNINKNYTINTYKVCAFTKKTLLKIKILLIINTNYFIRND